MSKKEFLKLDIVRKYVLGLCILGGLCSAISAIQIPFLLTGASVIPITIVSSAILLAVGIVLIVMKNMIAAGALLICSIINAIVNTVATRSFSGWFCVVLGIAAVILAVMIEKKWNEFDEASLMTGSSNKSEANKKSKKGANVKDARYGRVAEPVYTPAPSIDPAAIAQYQPNKNLTTVLASPNDPAPYDPNSASSGQGVYPEQPIPAVAPAQHQETEPAPAVAPAQHQETEPAPAIAHAQYQETEPAPAVAPVQHQETEPAPVIAPVSNRPEEKKEKEKVNTGEEPLPDSAERPVEKAEPDYEGGSTIRIEARKSKAEEIEAVNSAIEETESEEVAAATKDVTEQRCAEDVNQDTECDIPEKKFDKTLYGYKIVRDGLYGYHFFDGDEVVCTIEGVNASKTPVSIQGGGEHWYCINDWGINVAPGQRKYIINYADDMTNGILEYKERGHYCMNYRTETAEAVIDGDVTEFISDGTTIAEMETERGSFGRPERDGYSYAEEIRTRLSISDEAGVIRNLIMAFPLLYFG